MWRAAGAHAQPTNRHDCCCFAPAEAACTPLTPRRRPALQRYDGVPGRLPRQGAQAAAAVARGGAPNSAARRRPLPFNSASGQPRPCSCNPCAKRLIAATYTKMPTCAISYRWSSQPPPPRRSLTGEGRWQAGCKQQSRDPHAAAHARKARASDDMLMRIRVHTHTHMHMHTHMHSKCTPTCSQVHRPAHATARPRPRQRTGVVSTCQLGAA